MRFLYTLRVEWNTCAGSGWVKEMDLFSCKDKESNCRARFIRFVPTLDCNLLPFAS